MVAKTIAFRKIKLFPQSHTHTKEQLANELFANNAIRKNYKAKATNGNKRIEKQKIIIIIT